MESAETSPSFEHMFALFESCLKEAESVLLERNEKGEILAPNGLLSELPDESLCKVTRTPKFKSWFGDWENDPEKASMAVYESTGEPKVYYHGTLANIPIQEGLDERYSSQSSPELCFSDNREETLEIPLWGGFKPTESPVTYPCFLNVRNPYSAKYGNAMRDSSMSQDGYLEIEEGTNMEWLIVDSKKQVMAIPFNVAE